MMMMIIIIIGTVIPVSSTQANGESKGTTPLILILKIKLR